MKTTMSDVERSVDRPRDRHSGGHPVNIGHLVMGLAFVGLVGVWALFQGGVVAGIAGLLATTLTSRDRWGARQTGWVGSESVRPGTETPHDDPTEEIR